MNIEPQKFFIGLMDFFSILLPGALLTYLMMDEVGPVVLGNRYATLSGAQSLAAFLFASYLFGHLIFLLGSWLDEFSDLIRRYTLNKQIGMMARRGYLLIRPVRAMIWLVFKGERDLAVDRAGKIKQRSLAALQARDSINTFQWCKALLNTESPASLAVVQRFEADSKFFRCFAVVLLILLVSWPWHPRWPVIGIPVLLILLLLALWRYMEQRHKATNQAYWSVITLTAKDGKVTFDKSAGAVANPTHAGGVVFRKRWHWWGKAEYLLVEARDDPKQWVLPKGHVEEGEQHLETAVREVHEETGVWARFDHDLGDVSYHVHGSIITVRFYLMRAMGLGLRKDKEREHKWLPLEQAVALATHKETRELIKTSELIETGEMLEELLRRGEQRHSRDTQSLRTTRSESSKAGTATRPND